MQVGSEAVKRRKKPSGAQSLELLQRFKFQYKLHRFEILLKEACWAASLSFLLLKPLTAEYVWVPRK